MTKMFVDKFDEIEAEETGGVSPYGVQLLQQILTQLVKRVETLEKEVEELKKQPVNFTGFNYGPVSGMMPVSGLASGNMQLNINQLGEPSAWYTTTGIDEGGYNVDE